MTPLIIESAVNGGTKKSHNPNTPISSAELNKDIPACVEAGAAIIHSHIEEYIYTGEEAAKRYLDSWQEVIRRYPDAILCATATSHADLVEKCRHNEILANSGHMKMGILDPGSLTFGASGPEGMPLPTERVYSNSYARIAYMHDQLAQLRLGASIAIYEPGFLRATLAYYKAGRLAPGSQVKFYFGGEANFGDWGHFSYFGLPPTEKALDAYLEMIEGTDIIWSVAVPGGDVTASGLTKLAIERGGHVRVGLEDYHSATRTPTNVELIREVVDIAKKCGRPVADGKMAAKILGLPR